MPTHRCKLTPHQREVRARIMAKTRAESPARFIHIKRGPRRRDEKPQPVRVVHMAKAGPAYWQAIEKELNEIETELAGMNEHIQDFGGPEIIRQSRLKARRTVIMGELNSRNITQRGA